MLTILEAVIVPRAQMDWIPLKQDLRRKVTVRKFVQKELSRPMDSLSKIGHVKIVLLAQLLNPWDRQLGHWDV